MTFLQNLWRDLVDKRLWPVAVALLLGLVAVPFLIDTGSSAPAAPAAAAATAQVPGAVTAQIAVAAAPGSGPVQRSGKSRDPFKPLVYAKVPKATTSATAGVGATAKTAAGTASSSSSGSSSSGGSSSTGSTSKGTTTTSTTPTTTTTPRTTTRTKLFSYAIAVAVKRAGRTTTRRNLRAISYLPSAVYPLVTFLGVKSDGQTATFLLSDNVDVLGTGSQCRPSTTQCDVVELKAGENVLLAREPKLGEPVKRYRLVLRRVALREVAATPKAKATSRRATTRAAASALPVLADDLAPSRQVTRTRTSR